MKTLFATILGALCVTAAAQNMVVVDNSATRPYVDAKVAAGVAEAVGAIPTSSVAYATSAGTASNASNLNNVAAANYVLNGTGYVQRAWQWATNISVYSTNTVILQPDAMWQTLTLTNSATITVDRAAFPPDGLCTIGLLLNPGAYSVYWSEQFSTNTATNTIPGTAGLELEANATNLISVMVVPGWNKVGVRK